MLNNIEQPLIRQARGEVQLAGRSRAGTRE
jgi:hypothetical protein